MITVLILFLCVITAGCASILQSNPDSNRAREMLISNLENSHRKYESTLANNEEVSIILPVDLLLHTLEFSDFKDLKAFSRVSKHCNQIKRDRIRFRLSRFNERFVFEEEWFNELMFVTVNENFPERLQLTSPEGYDHVELMTLKHIFDENRICKSAVPKYIHLAIISFIHEVAYGFDSYVPCSLQDWIFHFGIKIQQHDFPLAHEYISGNYPLWKPEILDFFAQKPDSAAQQEFLSRHGNVEYKFGGFAHYLFEENVPTTGDDYFMTEEQAKKVLAELTFKPAYPRNTLKRIKITGSLKDWIQNRFKNDHKAWFYRDLFRSSNNHQVTDAMSYIWSRDTLHPFRIDELCSFGPFDARKVFLQLASSKMPFILQLDIASKLLHSGLLNLEEYVPVEENVFFNTSTLDSPIFEFILMEYPRFVNIFDKRGWARNGQYLDYMEESRLALVLDTQFCRNNPLGPVLFMGQILTREMIADRFNLNVKYSFDGDFSHFACGVFSEPFLRWLNGRTISFKLILKILGNRSLLKAYSVYISEIEERLENYPVYSLTEYFNNPNSIQ